MRYKTILERSLEAMQNTGDVVLRWQYQKDMMKFKIWENAEIERIAALVLSRISATVDVTEIIDQIEDLRRAIDNLVK